MSRREEERDEIRPPPPPTGVATRLEEAISSLPDQYREVLLLRHQGERRYDEIAEITPDIQVKLLRAIEEGRFEKVGDSRTL